MIKKFLFITLSLVVICFFFIVSCNVSQYDECDEMGGANQLLSAFNVEYEKDQVKVYWLRKDLSPMPVTCPTATTTSNISCLGHDFASI